MQSNGKQSVGLAISLRDNGDVLKMGDEVQKVLKSYRLHYPIGIEFETLAYQPERVVKKINDFISNLIQAVIVVCAVMFLFLGIRVGLIVASLIPTVILITFVCMSFMGIGLNQITLASLIIALGMLVDNAIVMSESIMVQMKTEKKKPLEAAIHSAKELRLSLLISSLTTCAAFLPFYLAESGTGEYIGSLFLVVTMTLLISWFIALTMIPILCIAFIKVKESDKPERAGGRIYSVYRHILLWMLRRRLLMLGIMGGLFTLAIFGNNWVPKIFYPPSNTPMFTAEIELPVGSSIWRTEATLKAIDTYNEKKNARYR